MRILAVSDLHYRLKHYDWLVEAAESVDVVAVAGDLADVASHVPLEVQVVVLEQLPREGSPRRLSSWPRPGTTTSTGRACTASRWPRWLRKPRADGLHTDGVSVDLGDTRFTVCPWWDGPRSRDAVEAQLEAAAADRPARWVWLYHAPPAGTVLCRDGRREFPDHDLAGWIAQHQPDLVLCGHIHQAPWVDGGSWHDRLGSTLGLQRRPPDRPGAAAHHARHRGGDRRLVRRVREPEHPAWLTAARQGQLSCAARGRAPSQAAQVRPGGAPACPGSAPTMPRCPSAPASCCFTSARYWVMPSSRDAVIRSMASATPGRS